MAGLRQLTELSHDHDLTVIGIGGRYEVAHGSFVGMQTNEQVRGIHVDAVFMSAATDMCHQEKQIVALKREMLNAATKRYLLVDHTQLNRLTLLKIASLAELDLVITDAHAHPEFLSTWSAAGIEYEIARQAWRMHQAKV